MSRLPYYFYVIYHFIYKCKIPFVPNFLCIVNRIVFGAYIPPTAKIGAGTKFSYGGAAIVIHARAKIGTNCIIGPAVTIGGRSKVYEVPTIEDNVFIGGGAKILGAVVVGKGSIIGANSVVLKDVPSRTISVGIPSKVIKENIDKNDYI